MYAQPCHILILSSLEEIVYRNEAVNLNMLSVIKNSVTYLDN